MREALKSKGFFMPTQAEIDVRGLGCQ